MMLYPRYTRRSVCLLETHTGRDATVMKFENLSLLADSVAGDGRDDRDACGRLGAEAWSTLLGRWM